MINLWKQSLVYAKKQKMKKLEKMFEDIRQEQTGVMILCPFCKYQSKKNNKGTAKIFDNGSFKSMKCFACGTWRKI